VPLGAEVVEALAARLTGVLVADKGVKRVPRVRHLTHTARGARQSQERPMHALAGARGAVAGSPWPEFCAGAIAHAHAVAVLLEQVERAAAGVRSEERRVGKERR